MGIAGKRVNTRFEEYLRKLYQLNKEYNVRFVVDRDGSICVIDRKDGREWVSDIDVDYCKDMIYYEDGLNHKQYSISMEEIE